MKQHTADEDIIRRFNDYVSVVERAFNESGMKGSSCEGEAYVCLAVAMIPDQFEWQPLYVFGQPLPRLLLIGYRPEIEEVLTQEQLAKYFDSDNNVRRH